LFVTLTVHHPEPGHVEDLLESLRDADAPRLVAKWRGKPAEATAEGLAAA
jgi:hypothetical protein